MADTTVDNGAQNTAPNRAEAARQKAEQLASTLPPLLVAAERVASTVSQGVHGRRRVGSGETFWQFRQYQPGDPGNRIDWRQSAKSQRVFIRETEWEAAQSVWLWRDSSGSMSYRSSENLPTKQDRANLLLLATASLLVRGGEYVARLGQDRIPFTGRLALTRLSEPMFSTEPDAFATAGMPRRVPLPRHARVVLIGDFLAPLEDIDRVVRSYGADAIEGHMVQVLDPAEQQFPFAGRTEFHGYENEPRMVLDRVQNVRTAYLERLAAHQAGLADIAGASGWTFTSHGTDRRPETPLMALYEALSDDWR